jgi:hypothetical protein
MADFVPPSGVSDPQIAAILEQNKKRRARAILIFVSVTVVLAVGLGGSAIYFSAQAKKKRNVAYSRVVKCLFGKPLASGEAPMTRVRSAWRARILAAKSKDASGGTLEDQEAEKTKLWPNRCVAEMIAFTDTLKDIGEMKEGDKDIGYYSRDLSKQTAGDNWKNVDVYQAAVEAFVTEADKDKFEFVDVPDVQAPELMDAESIDAIFPKSSALDGVTLDYDDTGNVAGASIRFFVRPERGKPARLCTTDDGKTIACSAPAKGGLPTEASGNAWVLGSEDGAPTLLAFGLDGGVARSTSAASGVFRSGDGLRLVKSGAYFIIGGYARPDGSSILLLKFAAKPEGDHFQVGRFPANATELATNDVVLTDWNERASYVALVGNRVVWVDSTNALKGKTIDPTSEGATQNIATLPGLVDNRFATRAPTPIVGCQTKSAGLAIAVPTEADGVSKTLVVFATDSGFGKADVVEAGELSCGDDAAYVLGDASLATCKPDGCKSDPFEAAHGTPAAIDGALVRAESVSGLLRVTVSRGGKIVATKIYDAQMKGTILLGESKLGKVAVLPRRGYGLIVAGVGDAEHFARVDASGAVTPVTMKEE